MGRMMVNIGRESSKESSEESDETGVSASLGSRMGSGSSRSGHRNKLVKQQSRQSEMSGVSASSGMSGVSAISSVSEYRYSDIGTQQQFIPEERRSLIRTDQDIDHNENQIQEETNICDVSIAVASSNPNIAVTGVNPGLHTSASDSALNMQTLKVSNTFMSQLSEVEESCSASDTGSINDLEKKKKKRPFSTSQKKKKKKKKKK